VNFKFFSRALPTTNVSLGIVAMICLLVLLCGCRTYAPVSSPESMQLIKRLYVACSARDTEKLSKLVQDIEDLAQQGKVTSADQQVFDSIIKMAKQGDWAGAEKAALKLADDQVGNSPTAAKN
jgi:hypothetical protein